MKYIKYFEGSDFNNIHLGILNNLDDIGIPLIDDGFVVHEHETINRIGELLFYIYNISIRKKLNPYTYSEIEDVVNHYIGYMKEMDYSYILKADTTEDGNIYNLNIEDLYGRYSDIKLICFRIKFIKNP